MHDHVKHQIDAYLDEKLDAGQRRSWQEHIGRCTDCRKVLQEAERARAYLQWLSQPDSAAPEPGPEFFARVRESIERKQAAGWSQNFAALLRPRLAFPLVWLTVLLMAWALTTLYPREDAELGLAAMEFPSTEFVSVSYTEADPNRARDLVMLSLVEPPEAALPGEARSSQ